MNSETFNKIVQDQINVCTNTLIKKADEYAADTDRLHNFRVAARMQGITEIQALAGMMAKHTTSIYDMCRDSQHSEFPLSLWQEKITDHINYLLLLTALVTEDTEAVSGPFELGD